MLETCHMVRCKVHMYFWSRNKYSNLVEVNFWLMNLSERYVDVCYIKILCLKFFKIQIYGKRKAVEGLALNEKVTYMYGWANMSITSWNLRLYWRIKVYTLFSQICPPFPAFVCVCIFHYHLLTTNSCLTQMGTPIPWTGREHAAVSGARRILPSQFPVEFLGQYC